MEHAAGGATACGAVALIQIVLSRGRGGRSAGSFPISFVPFACGVRVSSVCCLLGIGLYCIRLK